MSELTCEAFDGLGAELALGVIDAHERVAALEHLERCPACRAEIRMLSDVADSLVAMVPPAEPPAGFESRVLDHLSGLQNPAPVWRFPVRRVLRVAAAVALAGLIGSGGWLIGAQHHPAGTIDAGHLATAKLLASGQKVGDVIVDTDGSPWMSMQVQMPGTSGQLSCHVITTGGRSVDVGSFSLTAGSGMWAAPLPEGVGPLRAAQVVDRAGRVVATASFAGRSGG